MHNPIFLLGMHRSGSSLCSRILKQNTNILLIGEMHYLTPFRKDFRDIHKKYFNQKATENNVQKFLDMAFSEPPAGGIDSNFWKIMRKNPDRNGLREALSNGMLERPATIEHIFKTLIAEYTKFKGFNRCAVKFPVFVSHVDKLVKWYPHGKIAFILRDPRAVYVSKQNDPGGIVKKRKAKGFKKAVLHKLLLLYILLQHKWIYWKHRRLNGYANYAYFRYEDFLTDPEKEVRKLCAFAELPFQKQMLNPKKDQISSITGKSTDGFDKPAIDRWRDHISRFDNLVFRLTSRNSFRAFGYRV